MLCAHFDLRLVDLKKALKAAVANGVSGAIHEAPLLRWHQEWQELETSLTCASCSRVSQGSEALTSLGLEEEGGPGPGLC